MRPAYKARSSRRPRQPSVDLSAWLVCSGLLLASAAIFPGFLVRLAAIPMLAAALWRLYRHRPLPSADRCALLLAFLVSLPLIQLIPLPPEVWAHLPGREVVVQTFQTLQQPLTWQPISLSPPDTLEALLIPLPAIALFCASLTLSTRARSTLITVYLVLSGISVFYSLFEYYKFNIISVNKNTDYIYSPSGFFYNRNHFSAFLYGTIPFIVGRIIELYRINSRKWMQFVTGYGLLLFINLFGVLISTSRSGIVLAVIALVLSVMVTRSPTRTTSRVSALYWPVGAAIGIALFISGQFISQKISSRFLLDPVDDARLSFFKTGLHAIRTTFPFGSGYGTFVNYFALTEQPDRVFSFYVNALHNDYLQFVLEGGVLGGIGILLFLAWYMRRVHIAAQPENNGQDNAGALARQAAIALALLMVHAIVEYHLRSTAILCSFALFCSLLLPAGGRRAGSGSV